jgi:NAD-dependent dihydropyrimidine dehydrogenase PreA subunit
MMDAEKRDRGLLRVDVNECKGCGLCVEACPPKVIRMSERLNHYGYRTAVYEGAACTACGICFMVCPEPGAITVLRAVVRKAPAVSGLDADIEGAIRCASN